jgi:glycosyltransferase involved in cell wall biosynthesis
MSGLRVCMVTTFYPPHHFGGDAVAVRRLAQALARRGHAVTVVYDPAAYTVLAGRAPEEPPPADEGVEVRALRGSHPFLSTLLTQQIGRPTLRASALRAVLDNDRFDVIHYHNVSLVGGPGVLSLGRGIKLYTAHEHWLVCPTHVLWRHGKEACPSRECLRCVLRQGRPPQLWRYTGYLDRQLAHVDALIAMSEFSRVKHREFGLKRDMEVLPGFLPDIEPPAAGGAARPHDRPYFLVVGRLEALKGIDDVIPLFRDGDGADLLIVGDGTRRTELERLAAGNPRVRFVGRLPEEGLAPYYAHARALIAPSRGVETFGLVLIEAFRHGTPVIARNVGPFPEMVTITGAGELFATQDDLAARLRRLDSDDAHRNTLAIAARAGFRAHWSEDVVVPRYLTLIERAARRKGMMETVRALNGAHAA